MKVRKRIIKAFFFLIGIFVFGLIFFLFKQLPAAKTAIIYPIPKKLSLNIVKIKLTPTPTLIPTATLTPTPTPEPTATPMPGFCLRVPVLLYHHIQPTTLAKEKGQLGLSVDNGVFDQQMAYLNSKGYTTISALQLIQALANKSGLPGKSIVITIDDGYRDIFDYAYPIIQKYRITVNLAIPTGLMEGANYLTWNQIREMKGSGIVNFMNHTWSHYSVGKGNLDKIRYEVETANQQLEQNTGQKPNIFVYPFGTNGTGVVQLLQEEGFIGAFSTIPGYIQCDSILMSLRRNRIGNSALSYYGL